MKKLLGSIAAAAVLLVSGIALGDEATARIQTLNAEEAQLSLDNGMTFSLGEGVSVEGLQTGDEVHVTYEDQDGQKIIMKIEKPAAE